MNQPFLAIFLNVSRFMRYIKKTRMMTSISSEAFEKKEQKVKE